MRFRFGTVGIPTSTPAKPGGTIGGLNTLHALGLDALELGWVRSVNISETACENIRAKAAELNIALSVHASYFINVNADEEEWIKSRQRLLKAAHYGNLAGATDVIFHPGTSFGNDRHRIYPVIIKRLEECVSTLRSQNNPILLRPETMGKQALLGSLEDVLILSASVPGVAPCLDVAHLHARTGNGSLNCVDEWMEILELYSNALGGDSLKNLHLHISGIEYSSRGERRHLALEESDLNIRAILEALWKAGCAGRVLCESPILEKDALLLQKIWETEFLSRGQDTSNPDQYLSS